MLQDLPNEGMGTAIIYEDLLGGVLSRLRRLVMKVGRKKLKARWVARLVKRRPCIPLIETYRKKTLCVICLSGRSNEASYIRTTLDFSGDPEFDRAFDRSSGICLPHLLQLIELGRNHPRLEGVLKKTEAKWQELQDLLKRFIDKHDYRATEKVTEEEARSWRQALEMLTGAPGLFGNELHPARRPPLPDRPVTEHHLPAPSAGEQDLETLRFEKAKLELRLKQLNEQHSEISSRAAALHYRLGQILEDRQVLEMHLSAERASGEIWKRRVEELKEEVKRLQGQLESGVFPRRSQ